MKKDTYANKLNELLGIKTDVAEGLASNDNPLVKKRRQEDLKRQPALYGYTDDEFADIRIMQGTLYFLQAPELFTIKQCPTCSEWFAVSRQAVGYCSYHCLNEAFKREGMTFSKGGDLEALAQDDQVWRKNEPLWTMKLDRLKSCLSRIIEATESTLTSPSIPDTELTRL